MRSTISAMPISLTARFLEHHIWGIVKSTRELVLTGILSLIVLAAQYFGGGFSREAWRNNFWKEAYPLITVLAGLAIWHAGKAAFLLIKEIETEPRSELVESDVLLPNGQKHTEIVSTPPVPYLKCKVWSGAVFLALLYALGPYLAWQKSKPAFMAFTGSESQLGALSQESSGGKASNSETEERPWLGLDNTDDNKGIVPYGSLGASIPAANGFGAVIEAAKATFYMTYLVKNFGRSPANVEVTTEAVDKSYPTDKERRTLVKGYCDNHSVSAEALLLTINPGTTKVNRKSELAITPDMIRNHVTIRPTIIGCIWYQSTVGNSPTVHKTPFAGHIYWVDPKRSLQPVPLSQGHIAPDKLKVVDVFVMGKAN
jgi:hypothetical protein